MRSIAALLDGEYSARTSGAVVAKIGNVMEGGVNLAQFMEVCQRSETKWSSYAVKMYAMCIDVKDSADDATVMYKRVYDQNLRICTL